MVGNHKLHPHWHSPVSPLTLTSSQMSFSGISALFLLIGLLASHLHYMRYPSLAFLLLFVSQMAQCTTPPLDWKRQMNKAIKQVLLFLGWLLATAYPFQLSVTWRETWWCCCQTFVVLGFKVVRHNAMHCQWSFGMVLQSAIPLQSLSLTTTFLFIR